MWPEIVVMTKTQKSDINTEKLIFFKKKKKINIISPYIYICPLINIWDYAVKKLGIKSPNFPDSRTTWSYTFWRKATSLRITFYIVEAIWSTERQQQYLKSTVLGTCSSIQKKTFCFTIYFWFFLDYRNQMWSFIHMFTFCKCF